MKFLVDECLHSSLTTVANHAGFEAHHVVHYGLRGAKDHELIKRAREENFVFVTNNATDFKRLFSREPLHSGLIILVPSISPDWQRQMFQAALDEIEEAEPINSAVEVTLAASVITVEVFPFFSDK